MASIRDKILNELGASFNVPVSNLSFVKNSSNGKQQVITCKSCTLFKVVVRKHKPTVGQQLAPEWYLDRNKSVVLHNGCSDERNVRLPPASLSCTGCYRLLECKVARSIENFGRNYYSCDSEG